MRMPTTTSTPIENAYSVEDSYIVVQITDNEYDEAFPQVSDGSHVVWAGKVGNQDYEIFLYNRTTITQITDNGEADLHPTVNINGYVVWDGLYRPTVYGELHSDIFLYNGSGITRLTDNWEGIGRLPGYTLDDIYPQINNVGHVTWKADAAIAGSSSVIFLYNESTTFNYNWAGFGIPLNSESYRKLDPQININDHVVWYGNEGGEDAEVFYYNGVIITQ